MGAVDETYEQVGENGGVMSVSDPTYTEIGTVTAFQLKENEAYSCSK